MATRANHARKYNNYMSRANEIWAAKVLNMQTNEGKGPDIFGNGKFAEVKFTLINPKENNRQNYPRAWTVLEHQLEFANIWAERGFWAVGLYELSLPFKEIRAFSPEELEKLVVFRKLYLTPWNWIYQFPPHHTSGKTKYTEWDLTLRYPKQKDLPKTKITYEVEKGLVHLTKGIPLYMFGDINQN